MHDQVSCPKCGNEFALGEALRDQLKSQMQVQMKDELQRTLDEAKFRSDEEAAIRIAAMQRDLVEARKLADDTAVIAKKDGQAAAAKEADLLRTQRELEDRAANAAVDVELKLATERAKVIKQAEQAMRVRLDAQAVESEQARTQMEAELVAARKRADGAAANEAEVLRMRRELDIRETNAALVLEQTLAAERTKIKAEAEQVARARFEVQSKAEAERFASEGAIEAERVRRDTELARTQMQSELAAAKKRADDAAARELDLLRKQRDLEDRETNAGMEFEQKLAAERAKVKAEAERAVEERMKVHSQEQLEDLRRTTEARVDLVEKDLVEARKRVESAALKEVDLLRKHQELDDASRMLALETEKRVLEERKKIQEQCDGQAAQRIALIQDQTRLREKEEEEKTARLQRTVDQLQQRLTQGAQQAQGEAQELVLKDILVAAFDEDSVEDVAKGVRGADLVQRVHSPNNEECGIILWESKRTQGWSAGWIDKLHDDQREIGAACAVIVTQALPQGIKTFGLVDGVWVCGWSYASALGAVLRAGIQDLHRSRRSTDGRDTKMHVLYDYLIGHAFRNRVQGVIESIVSMQDELRNEERAYTRIWKKRASTMNRALTQIGSVYGDLQGIVGAKLEDITPLALPGATRTLASSDEDEADYDDADEIDHANVSVSPELESAMLALIPADGTAIGNGTLRNALATKIHCSEAEFLAVKSVLLAGGYVRKGKGRGGSVSRIVTASRGTA